MSDHGEWVDATRVGDSTTTEVNTATGEVRKGSTVLERLMENYREKRNERMRAGLQIRGTSSDESKSNESE